MKTSLMLAAFAMLISGAGLAQEHPGNVVRSPNSGHAWLEQEVRHQLLNVPWYSIFDDLEFQVTGDNEVTLLGATANPALKKDAEDAVKHIEGVTKVEDKIELLPVSPMDQQIRRAEYRAIYREPALEKYALGSVPPIHIIVKNAHVQLVGWVASAQDKQIAGARAMSVGSVFAVENDLKVENGR